MNYNIFKYVFESNFCSVKLDALLDVPVEYINLKGMFLLRCSFQGYSKTRHFRTQRLKLTELGTYEKLVVVVIIYQSENSELQITLTNISLVRRLPCSLSSYWYFLHILWFRSLYILLRYSYILSCLALPLGDDLDSWHLFPGITSIDVPSFKMTHAVLDIRDTTQQSLSLV